MAIGHPEGCQEPASTTQPTSGSGTDGIHPVAWAKARLDTRNDRVSGRSGAKSATAPG